MDEAMMKRYASRLSVMVLGLLLSTLVSAAGSLTVFNGEADVLKGYTGKGKWLVVMIWASDCHVCNMEAESYIMLHESRKDQDATLLGISTDGPSGMADAEAFIKRHHVTFPNLIAESDEVVRLYAELTGVYMAGTPAFLIFGPDGTLKVQQVGAVPADMIANFITENSP
jgi:peroxiredoxin